LRPRAIAAAPTTHENTTLEDWLVVTGEGLLLGTLDGALIGPTLPGDGVLATFGVGCADGWAVVVATDGVGWFEVTTTDGIEAITAGAGTAGAGTAGAGTAGKGHRYFSYIALIGFRKQVPAGIVRSLQFDGVH